MSKFGLIWMAMSFSGVVAACDGAGTPPVDGGATPDADSRQPDASAAGPQILSVTLTETPANVLAYVLDVQTGEAASIAVRVEGPGGSFTLEGGPSSDTSIWIGGLRPESTYDLTITATDTAGNTATDRSHHIETDALPDGFPPLTVNAAEPDSVAPGYTLFTVFRWSAGEHQPADGSWLVMLDSSAAVIWYQQLSVQAEDAHPIEGGNLLFTYDNVGVAEMDVQGNYVRRLVATATGADVPDGAIPVDLDSIHHAVTVLPNGDYLLLSTERRAVTTDQCPNYTPPSGDSLEVVGDRVVELEPQTGAIVASVSAFDDLDPCRRTDHDFGSSFWNVRYGGVTTQDWTHGNAVFYDAEEGLVVASYRHQDWIVAYHWELGGGGDTGELAFLLGAEGEPGDYGAHPVPAPTGAPFEWSYHQHAPVRTPSGTLMMFDNGNLRPGTNFDASDAMGDGDLPYSRVVEYAYDTSSPDPSAWTIHQVWEWRPSEPGSRYAAFVGNAQVQPNDDVLMTFGGLVSPPSDAIADPSIKKHARLIEVTRGATEAVVFDVEIVDPADTDFDGYTVYRAYRVPETLLHPQAP